MTARNKFAANGTFVFQRIVRRKKRPLSTPFFKKTTAKNNLDAGNPAALFCVFTVAARKYGWFGPRFVLNKPLRCG